MTKEIPLTQGKVALVDDDDFERLIVSKWCVSAQGYAIRHLRKFQFGSTMMHREILGAPKDMDVDHVNLNKLDNRRVNLRLCKMSQNIANSGKRKNNTSGYKGVSWSKQNKKWYACIKVNRKTIDLGRYDNILDAVEAHDVAAKKYFGEFARINFPNAEEQ